MTEALYNSPKSGRLIPPVPFFFLKIALAIRVIFLYFSTNCEIICYSSLKNTIEASTFLGHGTTRASVLRQETGIVLFLLEASRSICVNNANVALGKCKNSR